MTVKKIIMMAAELCGKAELSRYLESEVTDDVEGCREDVKIFLSCYNAAATELASGYAPLKAKHSYEDAQEITYKSLPERPIEILSVTDKDGDCVAYERLIDRIKLYRVHKTLTVSYRYLPAERDIADEGDYPDVRITPQTLALGVASAYMCAVGASASSNELRKRFDSAVRDCMRPRRKLVLPKRAWR